MDRKKKTDQDNKAAKEIAEIMYAALMNLPEEERDPAIKDIQSVKSIPIKQI